MGEDRPDRREEGGWNVAVMDDKGRWLPDEGEREKRKEGKGDKEEGKRMGCSDLGG
jgi:hypothetical protein